jgi:ABC-type Fe3+/spermidine/putrescine transport system ATPase subunit
MFTQEQVLKLDIRTDEQIVERQGIIAVHLAHSTDEEAKMNECIFIMNDR